MRVYMFRLRLMSERQARWKNGQPPHRTTGVASTNSLQIHTVPGSECTSGRKNISRMAMSTSGMVNTTPTQKRHDMERNSGSAPCVCAGSIGSSAIPHLGQAPG